MKIHVLLTLAGLAIGFVLPTVAQEQKVFKVVFGLGPATRIYVALGATDMHGVLK
jgi:hypothetical protein